MPGTEDGESSSILVTLGAEELEIEAIVSTDGCPDQSDRVRLVPAAVECPQDVQIEVLNEDGKPIPLDDCLENVLDAENAGEIHVALDLCLHRSELDPAVLRHRRHAGG